ncbi:MAG: TPM domain-containing protein [Clostridia bacterium]|nr:TPM domain-containing protein [Clostridia bacterium]
MNIKRIYIAIIIFVIIAVVQAPVMAADEYPSPTTGFFVNDFANVIKSDTEYSIIDLGRQLEDKTGAQVVVVTIDTLGGKNIADYALELGREWGIGKKEENNGVLLLNAVQEREIDIEVGYGLEGAIPDVRAREIIRDIIKPYLKDGNYDSGLLNGYIAVINDVAKEYGIALDMDGADTQLEPQRQKSLPDQKQSRGLRMAPLLISLLLIVDGVLFRFRITSTLIKIFFWSNIFRGGRGGGWGGSGGGGSWGGSSGGGGSFGGGGSSDKY